MRCPTCRAGTQVSDLAYVDNGRNALGAVEGSLSSDASNAIQESSIEVAGSYGTKVSPIVRTACIID